METLSWASLKALMMLMAANPASEAMVEHLVEGLRAEAWVLTPELIRRRLAMTFAALVDPSFPPSLEGPTMT